MEAVNWDDIPDEAVRPGVRRRGFGTDRCLLVLNECEPGMDLRPHVHDFDQIAMILEGHANYYVSGTRNEMGPGSVLLVPAGEEHYIEPVGDRTVKNIDVFTPLRADLSHLEAVIDGLAPKLTRDCLVVGKSTVPVGTAARLAARLATLVPNGLAASLAWNPEFLREGYAVQDTLRPDRLVVGVVSPEADATLRAVYAPLLAVGTPYLCTNLATAELAKVAANSFLATKVSFINAMAEVCEAAGADVVTLADALGYDSRIGRGFLSPGLGYGGGCLPKDVRAFLARADELGVAGSVRFLEQVDEINSGRRRRAVGLARELAGGSLAGRNVAVLGAAFKPGTDDVRDSPALAVAAAVRSEGAVVRVHDPLANDTARLAAPQLDYADGPEKACDGADVVLHLTEWSQYRQLDPAKLRGLVRVPRILDARNVLPLGQWRAAGWAVRSMGATW